MSLSLQLSITEYMKALSASLSSMDRIRSAVLPGLSLAKYLSSPVNFCSLKMCSFAKIIPILSICRCFHLPCFLSIGKGGSDYSKAKAEK